MARRSRPAQPSVAVLGQGPLLPRRGSIILLEWHACAVLRFGELVGYSWFGYRNVWLLYILPGQLLFAGLRQMVCCCSERSIKGHGSCHRY